MEAAEYISTAQIVLGTVARFWPVWIGLVLILGGGWFVRGRLGTFGRLYGSKIGLVGIGIVGWRGFRRHRLGTASPPHDADTPADRHRFLGFATLLLSALSAVAVLYAALVAVFIGRCY